MHNGVVCTVDSDFTMAEAIAIDSNGRIAAVGSSSDILDQYTAGNTVDLNGKFVYPGFIDAHSHFYGFGKDLQELDLKSSTSFEDMVNMTVEYAQAKNPSFIIGRGWNEEDWEIKGTISKFKLDILFPEIPVVLQRVDGHACLCNQAALDLAGINSNTIVEGGIVEMMGDFLTGMLIDRAADLVMDKLPDASRDQKIAALVDAQQKCYAAGLSMVSDAGLDGKIIQLIDSLFNADVLSIPLYTMANPDSSAILELLSLNSERHERHMLTSVKLYADGALGSRGALLKEPYCDRPEHYGLMQHPKEFYRAYIDFCDRNNLQVNTHCIGDSANKELLLLYAEKLQGKNDKRWRIEHAQIVDPRDIHLYQDNSIIPSIQPTHATSDAKMAQERLCYSKTMNGAYTYRTLLDSTGLVALGTDFPVESIDPLDTYFAAVKRKSKSGMVFKGEEALTPKQALIGMTRDAAYACRADKNYGTIEAGKVASFTILNQDLLAAQERSRVSVHSTYVHGKRVY